MYISFVLCTNTTTCSHLPVPHNQNLLLEGLDFDRDRTRVSNNRVAQGVIVNIEIGVVGAFCASVSILLPDLWQEFDVIQYGLRKRREKNASYTLPKCPWQDPMALFFLCESILHLLNASCPNSCVSKMRVNPLHQSHGHGMGNTKHSCHLFNGFMLQFKA